jgi:tetratricopeptide (TPR) repeat protein
MRPRIRIQPLLVGLLLIASSVAAQSAEPAVSGEAPKTESVATNETRLLLENSLRLQQQLQENLIASERARLEAAAASRTNTEALAAQLHALERTVADRQETQAKSLEKTASSLLLGVGLAAGAGLLALLVLAWAQMRGMGRLATAVVNAQQLSLAQGPSQPLLTESSSLQLFNALDRLEKRIGELEEVPSATFLNGSDHPDALAIGNGTSLRALIGKGQVLMNLGNHEAALACYERALAEDPNHVDGLMKKAAALERLLRLEEALVCYDTALAIRPEFTQAQLAKASVLNQLERFNEALNCFETAIEQQRASA